jgi:hypothetical protein
MRVVLTAFFLLVAAGLVDAIFFDGTYGAAVVYEANYQGRMFMDQVGSLASGLTLTFPSLV